MIIKLSTNNVNDNESRLVNYLPLCIFTCSRLMYRCVCVGGGVHRGCLCNQIWNVFPLLTININIVRNCDD